MPHSSGGGSHGGGSHGGSHGGSSGPRISSHYFAGSRRYRRHHYSTGQDEYIYASSKPQKTSIASIVIIAVTGAVFTGATGMGVFSEIPRKLHAHYLDSPAVHDNIDAFADDDSLEDVLDDYQELTGICPVIYSVYDEDWKDEYEDLEAYAYDTYVDNFKDEDHWVFVYSVSYYDLDKIMAGEIPDYSWEAIQGDNTDPILTESMFKRFANIVQDDLENGIDPGTAFEDGFAYAIRDAKNKFNISSPASIFRLITSMLPLLFVAGMFVPVIILMIRKYKSDKDIDYDEVPFDGSEGKVQNDQPLTATFYTTTYSPSGTKTNTVTKAASVFGLIFIIPFVLVGIGTIIGGIALCSGTDTKGGIFMLIFGIIWTLISVITFIQMIKALIKGRKTDKADPVTTEYPKAEYPDMKSAGSAPATSYAPPAQDAQKPEFDPVFFNDAKSSIEDDDEDYKRMKRQGFE